MRSIYAFLFGGLVAFIPVAYGDEPHLDSQELAFLRERASDDVFIWRLAEYASQHATTDATRNLGKDIVKERRTDLRDIAELSQRHKAGVEQPKDLTLAQKNRYDELTAQHGISFDKGFTKLLVQDYGTAIPQLDRESKGAVHETIKTYAAKNLSMFKDHDKQAHDAEKIAWGS